VVRDPKTQEKTQDELIERTRDTTASPEQRRARPRPFLLTHTAIANPDVAREIVARADDDFERIFGSE
jgi:hypothetical protein